MYAKLNVDEVSTLKLFQNDIAFAEKQAPKYDFVLKRRELFI